jgi:hypothetical protein
MRESRSYGSVRGVAGDRYPYRDCSVSRNLSGGPPKFGRHWTSRSHGSTRFGGQVRSRVDNKPVITDYLVWMGGAPHPFRPAGDVPRRIAGPVRRHFIRRIRMVEGRILNRIRGSKMEFIIDTLFQFQEVSR